jgi:hypothetical protein
MIREVRIETRGVSAHARMAAYLDKRAADRTVTPAEV